MKNTFLILCLFISAIGFSQPLRLHLMGGFANNTGDIQQKRFTLSQAKAVITAGATFNLTNKFALRSEYSAAKLGADDKLNGRAVLRNRNLNFSTVIQELSFMGEYDIFNLYEKPLTPYIFAGVAVFRFSPYTYDSSGNKVYLAGLSTEGQGFPEYPSKKVYKTTQFNIPFGGGVKYAVSDDVHIGFEIGIRKLFTDYLDDVSTTYADKDLLLARKGSLAVDLAYRGDEVKGSTNSYPGGGSIRGSSKSKDFYYFGQFRISFRMNWFDNGGGTQTYKSRRRGGIGCPSW